MDLDLLDTLKNKLTQSNKFDEIMTYFLDHFAENPQFLKLGRREVSGDFEQMIALIAGQALRTKGRPERFVATWIDEKNFAHGGGFWGGHVFTVIYFADIGKGLLAIHGGGPRTDFFRFTGRQVSKGVPENN